MDTNEWTPERVMSELRANATSSGLDDDLITGLATRALFLMGRGHTELEP